MPPNFGLRYLTKPGEALQALKCVCDNDAGNLSPAIDSAFTNPALPAVVTPLPWSAIPLTGLLSATVGERPGVTRVLAMLPWPMLKPPSPRHTEYPFNPSGFGPFLRTSGIFHTAGFCLACLFPNWIISRLNSISQKKLWST